MRTHPTRTWGTPRFFDYRAWLRRRSDGSKDIYVPGDTFQSLSDGIAKTLGWQIFWKPSSDEAGIFKVDFIARVPDSAPLLPDRSEVMEIFGRVCNHVESVPEFVCTGAGWRYGVLGLSAKKCTIQTLLLCPSPKCGCNPWLNARASREVYECLREWLKGLD